MRNNHLRVGFQARLNVARFPVPKDHISRTVSATDPFTIRRKPDLTGISSHLVISEAFLAVLSEVVGTVYQDLIVHRLSRKVFICEEQVDGVRRGIKGKTRSGVLDGWSVTAGIECMYGSAIYLITTGIS